MHGDYVDGVDIYGVAILKPRFNLANPISKLVMLATDVQSGCLRARVNPFARSLAMANAGAPPCFDGNKEPFYECVIDAMPNKNVKCGYLILDLWLQDAKSSSRLIF